MGYILVFGVHAELLQSYLLMEEIYYLQLSPKTNQNLANMFHKLAQN